MPGCKLSGSGRRQGTYVHVPGERRVAGMPPRPLPWEGFLLDPLDPIAAVRFRPVERPIGAGEERGNVGAEIGAGCAHAHCSRKRMAGDR